ncbi:MAG: peptidoglycan DD-metalloendopeptidase family protein [Clostridiaceae bacterium]|nr:peptidoglycan DD-metalloendopeptidase family protein [Clostridiaceae bacterium]
MANKKNTKITKTKKRDKTRIIAAAIAGVLAFMMLASTIIGALSSSAAVTQSTVNDLKDKLADITSKKKAAKAELAAIQGKKSSILAEIEKIDAEIEAATDEIEVQQQLIAQLDELIGVKETELAASQQKEEEQYAKLKNRVRFMYENGSMSYLSILLSSDDFSEFLSRYEIISRISKYDKNLFEELKEIKQQIADQKASLESDRSDAAEAKVSLETNKSELETRQDERRVQMKAIEETETDAKAAYAEIAEEEDKLADQIKDAVAQLSSGTYVGGSFMWPLPAANNVVTCKFGMRTHPITGVYKLHTGVDLRATAGTKIYAANAGTVIKATYSSAYGYYVVIDHGGGVATLYAHMSKMATSQGSKVTQGTVIGYVGSTGYSTGAHLHFEIIKNGQYINPITEFPNFQVIYS